jgi:hypothetical protein
MARTTVQHDCFHAVPHWVCYRVWAVLLLPITAACRTIVTTQRTHTAPTLTTETQNTRALKARVLRQSTAGVAATTFGALNAQHILPLCTNSASFGALCVCRVVTIVLQAAVFRSEIAAHTW